MGKAASASGAMVVISPASATTHRARAEACVLAVLRHVYACGGPELRSKSCDVLVSRWPHVKRHSKSGRRSLAWQTWLAVSSKQAGGASCAR